MWATLETQFKGTGYNLKYQYFTAISEIQFRSFKDVDSVIVWFKSLKANLASLHIGLPDEIYTFSTRLFKALRVIKVCECLTGLEVSIQFHNLFNKQPLIIMAVFQDSYSSTFALWSYARDLRV